MFGEGSFMEFSQMMILMWVILIGIAIFLEASGGDFTAICFAIGGIVAVCANLLGFSFSVQAVVFLAVSFLCVIGFKPLLSKAITPKKHRTNVDAVIGMAGVVVEDIDPSTGTGRVKVGGMDWKASSLDSQAISSGTAVKIKEVKGVTLIVEVINV